MTLAGNIVTTLLVICIIYLVMTEHKREQPMFLEKGVILAFLYSVFMIVMKL